MHILPVCPACQLFTCICFSPPVFFFFFRFFRRHLHLPHARASSCFHCVSKSAVNWTWLKCWLLITDYAVPGVKWLSVHWNGNQQQLSLSLSHSLPLHRCLHGIPSDFKIITKCIAASDIQIKMKLISSIFIWFTHSSHTFHNSHFAFLHFFSHCISQLNTHSINLPIFYILHSFAVTHIIAHIV